MDITTVIINYQTPDLLKTAVASFKKFYPAIPLLIVDNGSEDGEVSKHEIDRLTGEFGHTTSHFIPENIYHGPAMDLSVKKLIHSSKIFFLDSDIETLKGGFLEEMDAKFTDEHVYGVGEIIKVNKRGFKDADGMEILLTPHMLIRRELYLQLPPFLHHGQPTIHNFSEAQKKGYYLQHFPVTDYIHHHWRGTSNRFGYGLGWKGKVDYLLNKMGW